MTALSAIPAELRQRAQWVGWRTITRGDKPTKVPVNPSTGLFADSTNSATWGTFADAAAGAQLGQWDGVGYVFSPDDPYCGIDLDDVIDTETGEVDADAESWVERFNTYSEVSPSGTGIHLICKADLSGLKGRKHGDRECYDRDRFFTMTGQQWSCNHAIEERQSVVNTWHAETFPQPGRPSAYMGPSRVVDLADEEILRKVRSSKQAPKFERVWSGDSTDYGGDASDGDCALCGILRFWCGDNPAAIDRLFRASGRMRDKWDAKRGKETYGERTIAFVLSQAGATYDPNYRSETVGTIGPQASTNGKHHPDKADGIRGLATTVLSTIIPEPVHWLVPNYIPLGKLVMFAGDGGHGKSTLTLHLTACLTTGRPCFGLDYTPPDKCEVLLVSCEDDYADTVVPRLLAAGADLSRVRRVDGVRTADGKPAFFSFAHYEKLREELEDRPKVKLVVIDPAGAYIGRAGVDDHKDSELRTLLDPMADLAARRRCTLIIVKHLNKGVTSKAVHKVSGSAGYVNACRVSFVIAPQPDDETRKLFVPLKFNITKKPSGLAFKMAQLESTEADAILDRFPNIQGDDRTRLAEQLYRPTWDGMAGMDADAALGGDADKQRNTRVKECADWLADFMGLSYSWPDNELEKAAKDKGFTLDNFKKAKTMLRHEGRLCSKPIGLRKEWWNWLGEKNDRKPDRLIAYKSPGELSDESNVTDETFLGRESGEKGGVKLFEQTDDQ